MPLEKHTTINKTFFAKGAGPSKKEWAEMIDQGVIEGKIIEICGKTHVWIERDDFMRRDQFKVEAANDESIQSVSVKAAAILNR